MGGRAGLTPDGQHGGNRAGTAPADHTLPLVQVLGQPKCAPAPAVCPSGTRSARQRVVTPGAQCWGDSRALSVLAAELERKRGQPVTWEHLDRPTPAAPTSDSEAFWPQTLLFRWTGQILQDRLPRPQGSRQPCCGGGSARAEAPEAAGDARLCLCPWRGDLGAFTRLLRLRQLHLSPENRLAET